MQENDLNYLRPFVRYAHITKINDSQPLLSICAYDFRLFYVRGGAGVIRVDGAEYRFMQGALILIRPGLKYSIINKQDEELEIVGFNFDLDFLNSDIKNPILPSRLGNFNL